jgi:putative DNA primase/helicase
MSVVEWVRVNRASPCPVCGRDHYCSVSADGGLVYCTKEPSDTPGKDGVGWVHKLRAPEHRNGHANGHARAPRVVGTTRYEIRDGDGALVAVHVRRDLSDGSKRVWWELPDGTKGLGGRKPTELPLYGAERLAGLAPGTLVVVCEGEKATEAVWGLGLAAVGTVTGADTIPEQAALDDLTDFRPLLWPDNDEKGRQHMERLGRRLVGEWPPMVLAWPDAPEKGDAADFVAAGLGKDELRALYRDAVVVTEAPAEPEPTAAPAFALTDLGNAERLVARHGDDVRWCDSMGRWFHWTGVHWRQVGPTILTDLAKGTVRAIAAEAEAATDPDRQAALLKWAKASESGRAIASMVSLTKTVTGPIAVDGDDLDADPLLLGVENGVVDLRTGAGRPPDRGDLVTKSCRAPFDAGAACPRWEAFLEQVFGGDAELVAYVQRAVGYSLTGSTAERVIFILHGAGANGKTTFQEVVAHILGTYAMSTPVETLIARKDRGIPNDVARLKSARFVSATETERGAKLAEAFIKAVTGGDRVQARFLHQEFFEFIPQLKLWLATNHRPEIAGGGKSVWSRIRLIPFEVQFPKEEQDPDLKAKLIAEAPGILAWAVRGCLEWRRRGLREPQSVRDANKRYEEDEDVLGAFLEDRAVVEPNVFCSVTDLYKAFKEWAESHGEEKLSAKAFSQAMAERRGIRRSRTGAAGTRGFSGVRLRDAGDVAARGRDDD